MDVLQKDVQGASQIQTDSEVNTALAILPKRIPELLSKRKAGQLNKTVTTQNFPLFSRAGPTVLGLRGAGEGKTLFDLGSDKIGAKVLEMVSKLLKAGYHKELLRTLIDYEVETDVSDISKIKIGSPSYNKLSKDSTKIVVLYKVCEKFEGLYKPYYVEINSEILSSRGISLSEYELELKQSTPEGAQLILIDTDELDTPEKIDNHKSKLKTTYVNEMVERLFIFMEKYEGSGRNERKLSKALFNQAGDGQLFGEFSSLFIVNGVVDRKSAESLISIMNGNDQIFLQRLLEMSSVPELHIKGLFQHHMGAQRYIESGNGASLHPDIGFNVLPTQSDNVGFSLFNLNFGPDSVTEIGHQRLSSLYNHNFTSIIKHFIEGSASEGLVDYGLKPYHDGILTNLSANSGLIPKPKEEDDAGETIEQTLLGYEIPANFSDEDLLSIGLLCNGVLNNLDLRVGEYQFYGTGYISPSSGGENDEWDFKGIFTKGYGFDNNNIIILKNNENGRRFLYVNIDDFYIDNYIYLGIQVSYYIKNREFLQKQSLYANMYHRYNLEYIKGAQVFPITGFEEQYRNFMKNIVAPNSIECAGEINPSNTLMVGDHGTGKSQFMINLLVNREFRINGQEFNLNATIITLTIQHFISLMEKDSSYFKQRLIQIQENINTPIVIIVEDIDTFINEKEGEGDGNGVAQMLTNFFEGLGSMQNVTLVASTNYPERMPPRLTRQNRFENLVTFWSLKNEEEIEYFFRIHIEDKGLKNLFNSELVKKYAPKMVGTNPSHIANFLANIVKEINFRKKIGDDTKISEKDIETIYLELNVNKKGINNREESMKKWLKELRSKDEKSSMGF